MRIKFTEETPVALLALLGVVISGIVSFYISSTQADSTAKSLRLEFAQRINQKLFEKRLDTYAALYSGLAEFGSKIEDNEELTSNTMASTLELINAWDRDNSVFVGSLVIARILTLRNILFEIIHKKVQGVQLSMKEKRVLFGATLELQKSLRAELGVFRDSTFQNAITEPMDPVRWKRLQDQESTIK